MRMTTMGEPHDAPDVDIVGIDLGTTNSAIARWSPATGAVEVIANQDGEQLTRSVVYFDAGSDDVLVGAPALHHLVSRPEDVVYSLKRFIGRTGHDREI